MSECKAEWQNSKYFNRVCIWNQQDRLDKWDNDALVFMWCTDASLDSEASAKWIDN